MAHGRQAVWSIPEVVNTAANPDEGRHDHPEGVVPIFHRCACTEHDSPSRCLPVRVTLCPDSTKQCCPPVEVQNEQRCHYGCR
jgi:hypothetical protein